MSDDWRIDNDGSLRTPSGMKVARVTPAGELEVMDRVEHERVRIGLVTLVRMWRRWRDGAPES